MSYESDNQEEEYALKFSFKDFQEPKGINLFERAESFYAWQSTRNKLDLWPHSRALLSAPKPDTKICDARGNQINGINFASQDYLSLASSDSVKGAAIAAILDYGVHSAGSAVLLGNTDISLRLENALAEFLHLNHVTLYPTGWAAGYGAMRGLIRDNDYIVLDELSHNCLKEGARASTKNISTFKHLDASSAEKQIARIRKQDSKSAILLVTESLFSMDSDSPDIAKFQEICHQYQASLLLDVAHDLGAMGDGGTGIMGIQNMLGKVDIVMGSFSKTFASNGGFVASNSAAIKQFLKIYSPSHTFSNALSPPQAATVLEALKIITSSVGDSLREKLMNNIICLRSRLNENGLSVMGLPSPIVPVLIGDHNDIHPEAKVRLLTRLASELGVLINIVGYPAVAQGLSRVRFQVMAEHDQNMAIIAADKLAQAIREADIYLNNQ